MTIDEGDWAHTQPIPARRHRYAKHCGQVRELPSEARLPLKTRNAGPLTMGQIARQVAWFGEALNWHKIRVGRQIQKTGGGT